jgi:hypothetical protein
VALFCGWNLIVQIASKMPERGVLRDEDGDLSPEDMALMTGFPENVFDLALQVLTEPKFGWICHTEEINHGRTHGSHGQPHGSTGSAHGMPTVALGRPSIDKIRLDKKKDIYSSQSPEIFLSNLLFNHIRNRHPDHKKPDF